MPLSEFIRSRALELPAIDQDVQTHGRCHQKSCGTMAAEQGVLEQLGGKGQVKQASCCGVAGAYHAKTTPIAKAIGEQQFKPHIDRFPEQTPLVADGFNCRGKIRNVIGREAMHMAEYRQRFWASSQCP